jgi:RimJ/RimL family protein N-acetyltransferase
LLRWRNDPEVRRQSFRTDRARAAEHVAWLARVLADDRRRLFICEVDGTATGQARIDELDAGLGEISVGLASAVRGRGVGRCLIALASERALTELGLKTLVARVKADNEASLRAFRAAGYRACDDRDGIVTLKIELIPAGAAERPPTSSPSDRDQIRS